MKTPTNLQLAIKFARRRINEGLSFDETSERTARFMYEELSCSVIEAQATSVRAAAIADAEFSSQYLDMSFSTSESAVIACPRSGRKSTVPMSVINHALRCLERQKTRSAAATV